VSLDHPSVEQLEDYSAGKLKHDEWLDTVLHALACDYCRQRLAVLTEYERMRDAIPKDEEEK
jgi:anti-sigma factor ChrR (cupin superfamily)